MPWLLVFTPFLIYQTLLILLQVMSIKTLKNTMKEHDAKMNKKRGADVEKGDGDVSDDDVTPSPFTDEWERKHALESTKLALVNTSLSLSWQLLLAFKLQGWIGNTLSYSEILLPLLICELYHAYGHYHFAKDAEKACNDLISDVQETDEDKAKRMMREMIASSSQKSVYSHIMRACFVIFLIFKVSSLFTHFHLLVNTNYTYCFTFFLTLSILRICLDRRRWHELVACLLACMVVVRLRMCFRYERGEQFIYPL